MAESVASRKQTILVIDDEDLLLGIMRKMLEARGYTVLCTLSVDSGLRLFGERHREVALVLLDYRLPDGTGDQVLVRLNDIDPGARVVVMSGFLEDHERAALIGNGAKGILTKPFSMAELVATVDRFAPPEP
jgi:DNA-binding response OmpR family regulator